MYSKILVAGLVFLLFVSMACAARETKKAEPTVEDRKISGPVTVTTGKANWEVKWNQVLAEAKKEGKVSLYGTMPYEVARVLAKEFKERYGIDVDIVSGRGGELSAKLTNEHRAGLYLVDVYVGGGDTIINLKPTGLIDFLEPVLMLPELVEEETIKKTWYQGKLPWIDKDRSVFASFLFASPPIVINTNLVKPEEITSYNDLLNPKWKKNMIINDPTTTGHGQSTITMIGWRIMDVDYLRVLAAQEPLPLRDQRLIVDWVAKGKYPIGIAPLPPTIAEFKSAGAPIEVIVPKEGTHMGTGSGNVSLIKDRPHPNAAKIFINWLLSKEGAILFSKAYDTPSSRLDIPTEGIDPGRILQPGVKYAFSGDEEWLLGRPEKNKVVETIFGPIIK